MKKYNLLLIVLLLFAGCTSDDSDNTITQTATITIDAFEVDNCMYTIKTESKEFFTTDHLIGDYSETTFDARITYRVTEEKGNCGFAGSLSKIKILKLVEL